MHKNELAQNPTTNQKHVNFVLGEKKKINRRTKDSTTKKQCQWTRRRTNKLNCYGTPLTGGTSQKCHHFAIKLCLNHATRQPTPTSNNTKRNDIFQPLQILQILRPPGDGARAVRATGMVARGNVAVGHRRGRVAFKFYGNVNERSGW